MYDKTPQIFNKDAAFSRKTKLAIFISYYNTKLFIKTKQLTPQNREFDVSNMIGVGRPISISYRRQPDHVLVAWQRFVQVVAWLRIVGNYPCCNIAERS